MPFDGEFPNPDDSWPAGPATSGSKRLDVGEAVRMAAVLIATLAVTVGPFALLALHIGSPVAHR